ncbi:MAG: leucine-rich repeat domain-containing protein [Clostridia bacterium]|nr:leucine-rich repeat domain-containing protein [Clostridia bacterium]
MKKKILILAIMIVALMSIFVISASAAVTGSTSNEYGDVTIVDGMESKNKYNDTDSKAVLVNDDGTFTTYPAYYIYNGSTGINMDINLALLNEKTGEDYKESSVIRVEVFENARLNNTFSGCSGLIEAYLPDSVYFHYGSFTGCSSLINITIPSSATQIPPECFNGCVSLREVEIPSTVTSLGRNSFVNCNTLSELKIPDGYTGAVPENFRKITNGKASNACTLIVPYTCTGLVNKYSIDGCNFSKIIFTGEEDSSFITAFTTYGCTWALSIIEYQNHCEVYFDGAHNYAGDGDCTHGVTCTRCNDNIAGFADHVYAETLVYPNGFVASGVYNKYCKNAVDCAVDKVENGVKKPIFTALADNGYSTNGDGIAFGGFVVNTTEFKKYNDLNENDITFGIFVANPKYLGDTFMENGEVNATSGFLKVDMTSDEYTNIKIMLDGFTGSAQNLELVISLYAYTDASEVEYIQSEHTACANSNVVKSDATLYTVTLSSVENKPYKDNLEALPVYGKEQVA